MRNLSALLLQAAAVIAGASSCTHSWSSCDGFVPNTKDVEVTPDVACRIMSESGVVSGSPAATSYFSEACRLACGTGFSGCTLPQDYANAFVAAQPDGGVGDAGGGDGGADGGTARSCPKLTANLAVQCSTFCEGRRTQDVDEPRVGDRSSLGDYFAACSYLEAVSALAFMRMTSELEAHDAPVALIERARRAIVEEQRHAELTAAIARRFGAEPERPIAPSMAPRTLAEVARENAVEGCVRETYGAALALVRASRARDAQVRAALVEIAPDECGHARLSWDVAEWAMRGLDAHECAEIARAMRAAIESLRTADDDGLLGHAAMLAGMPTSAERRRLANVLDETVFRAVA